MGWFNICVVIVVVVVSLVTILFVLPIRGSVGGIVGVIPVSILIFSNRCRSLSWMSSPSGLRHARRCTSLITSCGRGRGEKL